MNALSGLMNPGAIGAGVQQAFQAGQQRRADTETRNALAGLVSDPNNQGAMTTLAQYNPQAAMAMQDRRRAINAEQAKAADDARADQAKQMGQMRQLLAHAEQSPEGWAQAMSAAQSMGMDLSEVPQQYDPAWARQQLFIVDAFEKEPERFSGMARELIDAGMEPGSPDFVQAMRQGFEGKYAGTYVDSQGITRQRSIVQQGPQVGAVEGGYRYKGGDPADQNNWQKVGGPSQSASGSFQPLSDGKTAIQSLFPQAHISQSRRDPNSALGRKNPRSYHVKTGAAVDMRAIPGMTFEQAKQKIEGAGYGIIEAIDEYKNPSGHATAGHWHFVLGQR